MVVLLGAEHIAEEAPKYFLSNKKAFLKMLQFCSVVLLLVWRRMTNISSTAYICRPETKLPGWAGSTRVEEFSRRALVHGSDGFCSLWVMNDGEESLASRAPLDMCPGKLC